MGPTISVGMAQHHLAFPGSITLRPSTLIACVSDYVESLARHGFDAIYFLNGHGGNIATLTAAFSEIHAHASLGRTERRVRLNLTNWWDGPECARPRASSSRESKAATRRRARFRFADPNRGMLKDAAWAAARPAILRALGRS